MLIGRDETCFSQVVDAYSKLLWVVAGGIIRPKGSFEDVEECVSDVFMALWTQPQKYEPARGSLKSYLCIMAKSRALNLVRRRDRDNIVSFGDGTTEPAAAEAAAGGDYAALYAAVHRLKEPTREIVIRRFFRGEKPFEIAGRMGLPKKEVENRLYRGKRALKALLTEKQEVL